MKRRFVPILGLLTALARPLGAQATQDALTALATRISEKRAQVETLTSELDLVKADYNERLRSLASQRADLETQIKREQLRVEQIGRDMAEVRSRISTKKSDLGDTLPLAKRVLANLKASVQKGIPFQTEGRVAEIESLERLVLAGNLDASGFLARVWNQLEAEYRLSSDNGLYRQKVILAGREQMVEVARLGLVLIYFRTLDDHFGMAVPRDGAWEFVLSPDSQEIKKITALFDGLRKNLKEGYFPLPNPYFPQVKS